MLNNTQIVIVDEEVTIKFIRKYFPKKRYITYDNVFLRWEERSVDKSKEPVYSKTSKSKFDRKMISISMQNSEKSSDWWRRVGAVVTLKDKILLESHNHHVPSQHMPYIDGDPRDVIKAGEKSEISTAMHAEQSIISMAAKKGLSLDGASIYVTAFPCPICAKLIAYSGIIRCCYSSGHASIDGERILKANGVELVKVLLQPTGKYMG